MVISSLAASCCYCAENPLIPAVQFSRATSAAQVFFVLAIDLVLLRDVGDGLKDGGVILTALRINVLGSYLGFCILLWRATGRPDGYLWCPDQSKAGP
jgi:hypothetical protein